MREAAECRDVKIGEKASDGLGHLFVASRPMNTYTCIIITNSHDYVELVSPFKCKTKNVLFHTQLH